MKIHPGTGSRRIPIRAIHREPKFPMNGVKIGWHCNVGGCVCATIGGSWLWRGEAGKLFTLIDQVKWESWCISTIGHKSHDPYVHKKYVEAGVMTFVAHCTYHCHVRSIQTTPLLQPSNAHIQNHFPPHSSPDRERDFQELQSFFYFFVS